MSAPNPSRPALRTPSPHIQRDTTPGAPAAGRGLSSLADVKLPAPRQALLAEVTARAQGSPPWKARKGAEARELLALETLAPPGRLVVEHLDAREGLRALVSMEVPVGCRPGGCGPLVVEQRALIGIHYPQEALYQPLPGPAFVQILAPLAVWHANVSPRATQRLCLGATLPPGVRVKELVLMTYGALSMQSVMIDAADAAGVLNAEAAEWWLENLDRVPLTTVPFLGSANGEAR